MKYQMNASVVACWMERKYGDKFIRCVESCEKDLLQYHNATVKSTRFEEDLSDNIRKNQCNTVLKHRHQYRHRYTPLAR